MLDIIIPLTSGSVGLVCGWLLYMGLHSGGAPAGRRPAAPAASGKAAPPKAPAANEQNPEQLKTSAQELRDLTLRVAADVNAHQSTVRRFSDVLTDVDPNDGPDAIVAAVEQLAEANEKMERQLNEAQQQMQRQAEALQTAEERARTDALTKLANRRALDEHLDARFELRDDPDHPTSLMLMDVDHFKTFNDTHGHRAGDEVLRQVAALLQGRLAQYGLVTRYGGEEFAVVFDDMTASEAAPLAEQARQEVARHLVEFEGATLRVTASGGVAELETDETVDRLIERADLGLYKSKEAGRDQAHQMEGETPCKITESAASPPPSADGDAAPVASAGEAAKPSRAEKAATHLPTREQWLAIGNDMLESLDKAGVGLVSAVLQCDQAGVSETTMQFIIQQMHSCTRGIDRVGMLDPQRLAVWMPSSEPDLIVDRLSRACKEIAAAATDPESPVEAPLTVSIGVAQSLENEPVEELVERAARQAQQTAEAGGNRVQFDPSQPSLEDETAAV